MINDPILNLGEFNIQLAALQRDVRYVDHVKALILKIRCSEMIEFGCEPRWIQQAKLLHAQSAQGQDGRGAGTLTHADVSGGTFTVTNLGSYEIDAFTPIVNLPEVAILGMGRIVEKPEVYRGEIAKRMMMFLSLSFDHRVIDGVPAAEFLRAVRRSMERPYTLLI